MKEISIFTDSQKLLSSALVGTKNLAKKKEIQQLAKAGGKVEKAAVVIIFPAQLGTQEDYEELSTDIFQAVQLKSYTAPLTRFDWPVRE